VPKKVELISWGFSGMWWVEDRSQVLQYQPGSALACFLEIFMQ